MTASNLRPNIENWQERVDLAAAFRWTVRLNMHEAVANHFSLAINDEGTKFLMNRNQMHFSRVKASNLIVVDANDTNSMEGPDAPDLTAWGLHGGLHRHCKHAPLRDACSFPLCHRTGVPGRQQPTACRSKCMHLF